jgi:Flp pilus assembly protein TadG
MVAGKLNASFGRLKDGLKGFAPGAPRRGLLARWLRDERGAATTEFIVVGMTLIVMTIGVIEIAAAMIVNVLIEGGLREASRAGITGYAPVGKTREQMILELLDKHTQGMVTPGTATIEIRVYPSFAQVGQPEPFTDTNGNGVRDNGETYTDVNGNGAWDADMGVAGLGGPGDVVHYRVSYDWHLLTGLLTPALSSTGIIRLSASVVVRNEPY